MAGNSGMPLARFLTITYTSLEVSEIIMNSSVRVCQTNLFTRGDDLKIYP